MIPRRVFSLLFSTALLFLMSCSAGTYLWYRVAPDYPSDETETISVGGFDQPVRVYIDSLGVPHIEAENETDLVRAVGFIQARNRFFQMDVMRRIARGRLSELLGEQPIFSGTSVEFDRTMAGWGFDRRARADVAALDAETAALIRAYSEGVNAALEHWTPIEHRLVGVAPEPWQPEDSLAVGVLNAWTVSHNWQQEISRLLLALHGGADRAESLYPSEPWDGPATLTATGAAMRLPATIAPELRKFFPERAQTKMETARGLEADLGGYTSASNGWVIGGDHTVSGAPLLANDPHMAFFAPTVLFQMHLKTPDFDVIGVTVPGVPYVLSGHNRSVAWGMTSGVADVIDLFVEKLNPKNADEALGPDGWYPLEREELLVKVRDGSDVTEQMFVVRRTRHGPLLNDLYPGLLPDWAPPVSIQWDMGELGKSLFGLSRANRAKTVEELEGALADISSPITVWTAADVSGRIALFTNGRVPMRRAHRGTFPAPGWLRAYDWDGYAPAGQMPRTSTGSSGMLVHANNLVRSPREDTALFHVDSAPSYRFDRISELLRAKRKHDVSSFTSIQTDLLVRRARRLVPEMLPELEALPSASAEEAEALRLLLSWDFVAEPSSAAAAMFFMTYREASIIALRDEVDARGLQFQLSQRYMTNPIDGWLASADHPAWDDRGTPRVEVRRDVLQAAFRRAVANLTEAQGDDPNAWRWGRLQVRQMKHFFGSKEALEDLVNLPPVEAGGGIDTVWKSHLDLGHPKTPFRPVAGPVSRVIIDLGDIHHGWWVLSTGNSGWPGSPHYGDQHALWKEGKLAPMVSDWKDIQANAAAVLTLE